MPGTIDANWYADAFGEGLAKAENELRIPPFAASPLLATGMLLAAVKHPEWAAAWASKLDSEDLADLPAAVLANLPIAFAQEPPPDA